MAGNTRDKMVWQSSAGVRGRRGKKPAPNAYARFFKSRGMSSGKRRASHPRRGVLFGRGDSAKKGWKKKRSPRCERRGGGWDRRGGPEKRETSRAGGRRGGAGGGFRPCPVG